PWRRAHPSGMGLRARHGPPEAAAGRTRRSLPSTTGVVLPHVTRALLPRRGLSARPDRRAFSVQRAHGAAPDPDVSLRDSLRRGIAGLVGRPLHRPPGLEPDRPLHHATDPGGNSLRADANPLARAGDVRLGAAKPPGPRDRTRHVLRNIPPLLVAAAQPVCGLATGEL